MHIIQSNSLATCTHHIQNKRQENSTRKCVAFASIYTYLRRSLPKRAHNEQKKIINFIRQEKQTCYQSYYSSLCFFGFLSLVKKCQVFKFQPTLDLLFSQFHFVLDARAAGSFIRTKSKCSSQLRTSLCYSRSMSIDPCPE